MSDQHHIKIGPFTFRFVCNITPDKTEGGAILEVMPQARYKNARGLPLNKYGKGPFCKFRIPNGIEESGVYAITVNGVVKYIGECVSLSSRYNMGYGNISPRNCFIGGQETNCRLNNLIFNSAMKGKTISVWFHATEQHKQVESELRSSQDVEWNRV